MPKSDWMIFRDLKKKLVRNTQELKSSILRKGGFGQNVALLFSGNVIGQVAGLLLMPIISRLYAPEDYGIFAVFMAFSANLFVFSSLMYAQALVLPKKERDFAALLQLSLLLISLFTAVITLVLFGFHRPIFRWLQIESAHVYWYFIPLSMGLLGLRQVMAGWNVRFKQFRKASIFPVVRSILGRLVNVGYALIFTGSFTGLLIGEVAIAVVILILGYFLTLKSRIRPYLKWAGWRRIRAMATAYKNYPLLMLPGNWVDTFSNQLPIILFTLYTPSTFVGLFALGTRLLSLPLSVIENAIGPVFLQKGTEFKETNQKDILSFINKTFLALLLLGALPFGFLTIFGDIIFYYVFGPEWAEAGTIAAYVGVSFMFQLPWSASSNLLRALRKEPFLFRFSILLLCFRSAGLIMGLWLWEDTYLSLLLYTVGNTLAYLIGLSYLMYIVKGNRFRLVVLTVSIVFSVLASFYGLRMLLFYLFA